MTLASFVIGYPWRGVVRQKRRRGDNELDRASRNAHRSSQDEGDEREEHNVCEMPGDGRASARVFRRCLSV